MREGIKTSLLSILCVATAAAANAAPTVRTITGTYESVAAANDTASSRAGSLRSTGGFVRPTATLSTSGGTSVSSPKSVTTTTTTSGGSVATGGGTTGRVASTPRLSIGKYVGAPKSISSSGGTSSDLTSRIAKLESDVNGLEQDKQDNLQDSTYIYIDHNNNEVVLNLDAVRDDLGFTDREIEFMDDETGLYWHFVGEGDDVWRTVITWEALNQYLDLSDVDGKIAAALSEIANTYATKADLSDYVPYDVGTGENDQDVGKAMVIGSDGRLTPRRISVDTTGFVSQEQFDSALSGLDSTYVTIQQGTGDNDELIGTTMVIDSEGNLQPGGTFVTPGQLDSALDSALDDYVLVHQGIGENGELVGGTMIIDSNGDLKPGNYDDVYVSQYQGTGTDDELVGRPMVIDEDGYVVPSEVDFATVQDLDNLNLGALAYKDTVGTNDIDSAAVTKEKLDTSTAKVISGGEFWQEWWEEHQDELNSGHYVVAINGATSRENPPQLFRIITAEDAVVGDPDPDPDPDNP